MSQDVSYKFRKSYYIQNHGNTYSELELIVVDAETQRGTYSFSHGQSRGQMRDRKNIHNTLADAEQYIAQQLAKVSFAPTDNVVEAHKKIKKLIDANNQYSAFDEKIAADIDADIDYFEQVYRNPTDYKQALDELSKLEPAGIHAIVTGKKYPFSAVVHDFASGISHKSIKANIEALPTPVRKRLREFASQRNYSLSDKSCNQEHLDYKKSVERPYPKINRSPERIDNIIARAVDYMLRDALEYKYFKKTGNMEIFVGKTGQKNIDAMTDDECIHLFANRAMQNYGCALQVKRRLEKIISSNRDITPFISKLEKTLCYDGYVNQEIIRIMFDTLRPHFNKFKHNKKVTEFVGTLKGYAKDARLAKHISETFGLKDAPKPNKDKVVKSLKDAAKRLSAGNIVSDGVVLKHQAKLVSDFAVIPTEETFDRVKKSIKPGVTQQEILRKFASRRK